MVGKNDIAPLLHPFRSRANFVHAIRLLARQAFDRLRYRRGTRLIMGNALVARLLHDLKRQAVDIRYQTGLKELVKEGERSRWRDSFRPEGELRHSRPQGCGARNRRHRLERGAARAAVSGTGPAHIAFARRPIPATASWPASAPPA